MARLAYVRSLCVVLCWNKPVVCAALFSVAGCSGDPESAGEKKSERIVISSQGAALTAVENTELALKGVVDSGAFLADSVSLAETLNALGANSTVCETTAVACDSNDPGCATETTEVCKADEITPEQMQEARDDLRREVDDLVAFLRDEVFIEANVVADETSDTQVTYRLSADVLCSDQRPGPSSDVAVDPEAAQPSPDPECVTNAEKANLRIRLTQPAENDVDMTVVATNEDFEPLVVQLYHDRIGVKLDLAEGLETIEALGENVDEVTRLSGILQLQLVKNAPLDYSLQLGVLQDIELTLDDEGEHYAYSLTKTNPALELRANGNTQTVSASYNYGAIHVLMPFAKFASSYLGVEENTSDAPLGSSDPAPAPEPNYTGEFELLLAGYTGTVSYTANSDTFVFSDVSLGNTTSTMKHNGNVLAALDLNPNDGRKFNASIQPQTMADGSKTASLTLDPTIDVNLALSFTHVADQVSNLSPTLLNDKLRVWFAGENPTFAIEDERLRMVSGSFHMQSEQSPESNVDVSEGLCLVDSNAQTTDETASETLFGVAAAACE